MGGRAFDLAIGVLWAPRRAFRQVTKPGAGTICLTLFLARWLVTPWTTVRNLYEHHSPMLLPLPVGDDPVAYRYWELFWYAPYGMAVMLAIMATLVAMAGREGRELPFGLASRLVAVSYFAPWTFTAAADCVVIPAGLGMPYVMVAVHLAALAWSSALLAVGLHQVGRLDGPQALRLAGVAAGMFVVSGAVVMR